MHPASRRSRYQPGILRAFLHMGNPITAYEEPLRDLSGLTFGEDYHLFPFAYTLPMVGPDFEGNSEQMIMLDTAKVDFFSRYPFVPREDVQWNSRSRREIPSMGRPSWWKTICFNFSNSWSKSPDSKLCVLVGYGSTRCASIKMISTREHRRSR
jgi:hypothetical protein